MCSLSGVPILPPLSSLLKIARIVSIIGKNKISRGTIKDVTVAALNPKRDITAIINPRNVLPVSPIKIDAGLKLYTRKPRVAPNIIKHRVTSKPFSLFKK